MNGLAQGSRLGPYEIVGLLGAGGMGEVYRARDTRLGRDVAIKVLLAQFAADADRLRRFEHEARAVAALSHPNVLALYDVSTHEGAPFLVSELLEGQTLRDRLKSGGLTVRKAVETAVQIAQGLAAAHGKGIVHRDLKPENVFVTKEGHVKILDFGIAKLIRPDPGPGESTLTPAPSTETGVLMGTVGYMSPEQVRGLPADHRTDIFSFGCVLYEMLSGRAPFRKGTAAETMTAILHEEPAELARPELGVSPALERVVRRCLEKDASQRFESAHDVAFALEVASAAGPAKGTSEPEHRRSPRRLLVIAGGVVLVAATGALTFLWTRHSSQTPLPSFTRLTFRRGLAWTARFTPDGQSIIYLGDWEGKGQRLYSQRLSTVDARAFAVTGSIMATAGGEMAVLLDGGTLARVPLEGGTPREIAEHVSSADWARDGSHFAIVRDVGNRQRLECPIGKVLYETTGVERISRVRLSPAGDRIAFIDRMGADQSSEVVMMDLSGRKQTLSKGWDLLDCLAWWPDGREVWFTATNVAEIKALHAVTLSGKERLVLRLADDMFLFDISPSGRVLVDHGRAQWETRGRLAGDTVERDFSWLDGTAPAAISSDGTRMLFLEEGEGGGEQGSTYLRRTDGLPPVRLGDGKPEDASPDWKWALCRAGLGPQTELRLVPIGAGEPRALPCGSIRGYLRAQFLPDGKRVLIVGSEAGRPWRVFLQELPDGLPRPMSPEGVSAFDVSPDGRRVAFVGSEPGEPARLYVRDLPDGSLRALGPVGEMGGVLASAPISPDGRFVGARPPGPRAPFVLYPIEGGAPRPIPGLEASDESFIWSEDGRSLLVQASDANVLMRVVRVDLQSGRREPWLAMDPPDRAGVTFEWALLKSDGRYYAYIYSRNLYDLYLIDGLK